MTVCVRTNTQDNYNMQAINNYMLNYNLCIKRESAERYLVTKLAPADNLPVRNVILATVGSYGEARDHIAELERTEALGPR